MNNKKVYKYKGKTYCDFNTYCHNWGDYDGSIHDLIEELSEGDDIDFEVSETIVYNVGGDYFTEDEMSEEDVLDMLIANGEEIEEIGE